MHYIERTIRKTTDRELSRFYSLFSSYFCVHFFSYFVKQRHLCVQEIYVEEKIKLKQVESHIE